LSDDFGNLSKYCIQKWIRAERLNIKDENIIDEELLIQICVTLCAIDPTLMKNESKETLKESALNIRSQVKKINKQLEQMLL
jgi:hypothetical protein